MKASKKSFPTLFVDGGKRQITQRTRSLVAPDQWTWLSTVLQPTAIRQNNIRHHFIHHHPFKIPDPLTPSSFHLPSPFCRCFVLGSWSLLIPCFVLTVIESDPWPRQLYGIPYMARLWPFRPPAALWFYWLKGTLYTTAKCRQTEASGVRGWDLWKWGNRVRPGSYSTDTIQSFLPAECWRMAEKKRGRRDLRGWKDCKKSISGLDVLAVKGTFHAKLKFHPPCPSPVHKTTPDLVGDFHPSCPKCHHNCVYQRKLTGTLLKVTRLKGTIRLRTGC